MRLATLLWVLPLSAIACGSSSLYSSLSSDPPLDGRWRWNLMPNPAGALKTLSLSTHGDGVSGTGQVCGAGPHCFPGSVAVTGQTAGVTFQLTLQGDSAFVATYSGQLVGQNELRGIWTVAGQSANVFSGQPAMVIFDRW